MSNSSGWLDPEKPELHVHPMPDIFKLSRTEVYKGRRWRCECGKTFVIDMGNDRDGEWRVWREA